jgi:hypothetical protein
MGDAIEGGPAKTEQFFRGNHANISVNITLTAYRLGA